MNLIKPANPGHVAVFMDGAFPSTVFVSIDDIGTGLTPHEAVTIAEALVRCAEIAVAGYSGEEIRAFGKVTADGGRKS